MHSEKHWIAFRIDGDRQLWVFGPYPARTISTIRAHVLKTHPNIVMMTEAFFAMNAREAEQAAEKHMFKLKTD